MLPLIFGKFRCRETWKGIYFGKSTKNTERVNSSQKLLTKRDASGDRTKYPIRKYPITKYPIPIYPIPKWRSHKCPMTEILEKIDELASYFQKTYIKGETIGRQQRDPLFPPALWNHYDNAAAGLIRTTNAVEGWHNGVTSLFQGSHPSIHTFLEITQLDSQTRSSIF